MDNEDSFTEAQKIATSIIGKGAYSGWMGSTLQRSLRIFAPHLFEIENMAAKSNKTVAAMLGLVLEAGLEAIKAHLPDDVKDEVKVWTPEQTARLTYKYPVMESMLESINAGFRSGNFPHAKQE